MCLLNVACRRPGSVKIPLDHEQDVTTIEKYEVENAYAAVDDLDQSII